jgi:hypothetical protein
MSSIVLASSGTPSALGASVTFTASVTGLAPTGTINFKDGATSLAGCSAVALVGQRQHRAPPPARRPLSRWYHMA